MATPVRASTQAHRPVGPVGDPATVGWWEGLWRPFWVLPSVICTAALLAGILLPVLDARLEGPVPLSFGGNAESARSLLSTIATAMISVTGLVFSITLVVMQLASSQFTPRLLGQFLSSRVVQVTLGVFTASFVFALVVLRDVRGGDDPFVPQLSVTLAFLLVLASVVLFLAFIHHITESIQVGRVVDRLAAGTLAELERGHPSDWDDADGTTPAPVPPDGATRTVTTGGQHGVVERVHRSDLVAMAHDADVVVELVVRPGEVRHRGQPLAVVHGHPADPDDLDRRVRAAVKLGRERTLPQDPAFGMRQLVDIAERALSPGVNDPTTAVQVLDELHRLLRVLACRPEPTPWLLDDSGAVRLLERPDRFASALDLAVDEIAHYGADSLQVPARLDQLLADLDDVARPEHRAVVRTKRCELAEHAGRAEHD